MPARCQRSWDIIVPLCGNPISVAGGNKFEQVTDFETATPDKLAFTRYYNSGLPAQQTTMLGYAWRTAFDSYIDTSDSPGWVYIYRPDGQVVEMDYNSTLGWYVYTHNIDLTLTHTAPTWTLTDSDDTVWTYSQTTNFVAVLSSIRYRGGYTQTLSTTPATSSPRSPIPMAARCNSPFRMAWCRR